MDMLRFANHRGHPAGADERTAPPRRGRVHDCLRRCAPPRGKAATKGAIDLLLMLGAAGWTWSIAFPSPTPPWSAAWYVAAVLGVRLLIYLAMGLPRLPWRQVSSQDVPWLGASAALAVPPLFLIFLLRPEAFGMTRVADFAPALVTEPALYLVLLGGVRIATRTLTTSVRSGQVLRRVLVVGSGDAARALVWQIQNSLAEYRVVGLLDDDPRRHGTRLLGVPVLGDCAEAARLAGELHADQIVVAIPSLRPERLREVLAACEPARVPIRILPPLRELIRTGGGVAALREVRPEDLLPRPEVKLDEAAICEYLRGRTVLVTGGGGSIGSELCRQVLAVGAARLLVLGRGENSVFEIVQELLAGEPEGEVVPVICDVQDRRALRRVFARFHPEVVFHAAAHKHVPLMEQYPAEAAKNNVVGTLNVVRFAAEFDVRRFVLVSTDKAVNPSSVMGTTKRVAEKLVKAFAEAKDCNMVSVRFGNVLGSRGSVVPTMTRQIRSGQPVTVTDPEMVRYFMTIPEATQLILQAGAIGGRGEVFVLDMGHPVRILDLAKDLIRLCGLIPNQDVPIRIIGRRPGEKLCEDILHQMEVAGARKNGHFYIAPTEEVDLEMLLQQIQHLQLAAETGQQEQVLARLRTLVPAYRPEHGAGPAGERQPVPVAMRQAS